MSQKENNGNEKYETFSLSLNKTKQKPETWKIKIFYLKIIKH